MSICIFVPVFITLGKINLKWKIIKFICHKRKSDILRNCS